MFNQTLFNGVSEQQPITPSAQILEILYLFDSNESLLAVLPQDSFFSPKYREVLNGEDTFTFSFPVNREEAEYIQKGHLVGFKDLDMSWQIFEIKKIVDIHFDGLTKMAYCEHIFYELLDDIITDKRPYGSAITALTGMLDGTRWQVGIVDDLGVASTNAYYESTLSGVQKVVKAWKGELKWRCVILDGVITRYVDLLAMRGTDTGKQFVYSKDILNIEREEDISNIATALYGRGKGVETESGSYGRRLTFADVVMADKPAGQEWVGDIDALARWGRPGGRHRFDVFVDEDETDPIKLLEKTRAELVRRVTPRVTYRLDVVNLEQLTGYNHEAVRIGDMVRVIDREFKPELVVSARVIEIERDLLDPKNTKIVLGSFAPTIIDATINTQRKISDLENKPYNTAWLDGNINVLTNALKSATSNWYTDLNGNLIFESTDGTSAVKLAGTGIGLANEKNSDSTFKWRTFMNGNGGTMDEINTGVLNTAIINIISAGGKLRIIDNGLKVYDANNNLKIHIGEYSPGKFSIKMINGEIYGSTISTGVEGDNRGTIKIYYYPNPNYPQASWGAIDFYGGSGKKIMSLDTGAQQPALRFYDETIEEQIAAGFIGLGTGSSTREIYLASYDRGIEISTLDEHISLGPTGGQANNKGICLSRIRGDLTPYSDGGGVLGSSSLRWWTLHSYTLNTGDIAFTEKTCEICGGKFNDGDILVLLTKTILEDGYTYTIPVHERCKDVQKTLEVEVPEMITKYRMNDQGEVEEYKDMYFEEIEEEIMTVHPDYELDEDTGRFKRKMNGWNLELFGEENILNGIVASERVAKVRDTVITKKPKFKKIKINVGQIKEAEIEN